jgi:signal transduction histidine kinase
VVSQGHRASEVITRVRALIKNSPSHKSVLNANELIKDILVLVRPQLEREQIELRIDLSPDLPSISGDSVQLQQVVLNLVLNTIQAMDNQEGGLKELVVTSCREPANEIIISIRDSGVGIDANQFEHLFQPFFTTKPAGTGMGLAICRSIVESHGGRIWFKPYVNHGATFQFCLPTITADEEKDALCLLSSLIPQPKPVSL